MQTTLILIFVAAKKTEEATGLTRFLTPPVIAVLIIVGCFIFTRISYAILSVTVRRISDRSPSNAAIGGEIVFEESVPKQLKVASIEGDNELMQRHECCTTSSVSPLGLSR